MPLTYAEYNQQFISAWLDSIPSRAGVALKKQIVERIVLFFNEKNYCADRLMATALNNLSDLMQQSLQAGNLSPLEKNLAQWWDENQGSVVETDTLASLHASESNTTMLAKLRAKRGKLYGYWGCDLDFGQRGLNIIKDPAATTPDRGNILKPVDISLSLGRNLIENNIQYAIDAIRRDDWNLNTKLIIPISDGAHWSLLILNVQNNLINHVKLWDPICNNPRASTQLMGILRALKTANLCTLNVTYEIDYGDQCNAWSCFDHVVRKALQEEEGDSSKKFPGIISAIEEIDLRDAIVQAIDLQHTVSKRRDYAPREPLSAISSKSLTSYLPSDDDASSTISRHTETDSVVSTRSTDSTLRIIEMMRNELKYAAANPAETRFDEVMKVLNRPENTEIKKEFDKAFELFSGRDPKFPGRCLVRTLNYFAIKVNSAPLRRTPRR